MDLPKDAEILGTTLHPICVRGLGALAHVSLASEQTPTLLADLRSTPKDAPAFRIYFALEGIRGTFDATILNVFIGLPQSASPSERIEYRIGNEALYGLRRASRPSNRSRGGGMASLMDATDVIQRLLRSRLFDPGDVQISIVPEKPLPEPVEITIERIVAFFIPLIPKES